MKEYVLKISAVWSIALAILSVTGCVSEPSARARSAAECEAGDVSQDCILSIAKTALKDIEGDGDWISAATEYAVALDSNDRQNEALAILTRAQDRASALEDSEKAAKALIEIATALVDIDANALSAIVAGEALVQSIEKEHVRQDLNGKFASARAGTGEVGDALSITLGLPQSDNTLASFKARTLREIAVYQAKSGDFEGARQTLTLITMGLSYYRSTARSDIALIAYRTDHADIAIALLAEAEEIARAQDNGYFVAGALRDIGKVYVLGAGDEETAQPFFDAAIAGAKDAKSYQEKARALSRVGTKLADCQLYAKAIDVIPEALELAKQEEREVMRHYSFYEITGSAAFSGDFDTAYGMLESIPDTSFGSAASLKSATQRDVVWGLVRHGKVQEALALANAIETPREKVQALSRMVRLLSTPDMEAFARYL